MKKLFTLLTLLVMCVTGAWATDYVLSPSTHTSDETGTWTFVSNGKTFTITCSGQSYAAGSGTTADYIKMNRNKTWTINLPSGLTATSVKIEGWSNKGTGSSTVTNINGDTNQSYTYPNTGSSAASNTYNFNQPVTGSFSFNTGGDNQLVLKITITGTSTPTLTGTWEPASNEFYQGDEAPSAPSFSVGASNNSTPAASAYNVAYSLKEGSTKGIVTVDANSGITAISNNTVGTATVVATLTTANAENYQTPASNTFEYTVTVNAKTPNLTLDKESITLKSTPVTREASTTVTLTGAFLTGASGTATWTAVDGLTISPTEFAVTDGAASQEFTVTYNKDVATSGSVDVTFSDGTTSKVLTVNYSSVVAHVTTSVSETTTWDWSSISVDGNEFQLTANTTPTKENTNTNDIAALDFDGEVYSFNVGFPEQFSALKFGAFEYPARKSGSNKFFQGTAIKFTTTIPGKIEVTFSNTGSNAARCLNVDGTLYEDQTTGSTTAVTVTVPLAVGDHTLKGSVVTTGDDAYLRISKIVFTPAESLSTTITDAGWATLYTPWSLDFAKASPLGLTAYTATLSDNTVTLTEVQNVQAGTGVVLKGNAGEYTIPVAENSSTSKGDMIGNAIAGTELAAETAYILNINGTGKAQFFINNAGTIAAGKAYLPVGTNHAKALSVVFADDMTGITNANAAEEAAQPAKRIVNGQLVIEKNGKRYNAAGAEF